MKRQRIGQRNKAGAYHSQLLEAIRKYLPQRGLALQSSDRRIRWTDRMLVITAILMTWQMASTLQDAFESAREVLVSMYGSRRRAGKCLVGFLRALEKRSEALLAKVVAASRVGVQKVAGRAWRMGPWVVMAVDGTRIDTPRTAANEAAFGCAGKKKTTPQQLLTTVFHLATGLIWDWRRGRGDAAERTHLREMIAGLAERTLLLADAGFTGYDLLLSLQQAGHDFIIRVGRNVTLLRGLEYKFRQYDGIVHLWPQGKRGEPPLVLRLVEVRSECKRMCLLTNVLDESVLSDRQVADLYRRRWLVEVAFRSLKQTLSHRKMLSGTPANAALELDWAMVGLWMLGLMASGEVRQVDRGRWSAAKTLRAVRRAMRRKTSRPPAGGLAGQLRKAVVDRYVRTGSKRARDWPHKKKQKPPGCPKVRTATKTEVRKAQELRACKPAA